MAVPTDTQVDDAAAELAATLTRLTAPTGLEGRLERLTHQRAALVERFEVLRRDATRIHNLIARIDQVFALANDHPDLRDGAA